MAATAFAMPVTTFLAALTRASVSCVATDSTASMSTPAAAPKYPEYTATRNTATVLATPARPGSAAGDGRRRRGASSSTMDAPPISHGTTTSKTPGGVVSNNVAPAAPPRTLTTLSRRIDRP
jgi:hypothetical protein